MPESAKIMMEERGELKRKRKVGRSSYEVIDGPEVNRIKDL